MIYVSANAASASSSTSAAAANSAIEMYSMLGETGRWRRRHRIDSLASAGVSKFGKHRNDGREHSSAAVEAAEADAAFTDTYIQYIHIYVYMYFCMFVNACMYVCMM